MEEIWKDLIGFEKGYQISNLGRLKSKERIVDYGWKKANRLSKLLSFREGKYGYLYTIISINKIRKTVKPHRLVALNFIPNPLNLPEVNHLDGNKLNNAFWNLEWSTKSNNIQHAFNIGLKISKKGESSHYAKLNKEIVSKIREDYKKENITQLSLSRKYEVSQAQIQRIVTNKNWVENNEM